MVGRRIPLLLLYACAAAIGLALEVLWLKRLALLFGASLPAVGMGLSVFIASYALGAAWVARRAKPSWNVRTRFAALQILTGIWCLAVPWLFFGVEWIYDFCAPSNGAFVSGALRMGGAAILVGPPAAALGALYPLLSGAGARRVYVHGMAGSVAGALLAGVVPSAVLGFDAAFRLIGSLSLGLALLAWRARGVPAVASDSETGGAGRAGATGLLLGVSLFAAQAVWFRVVWLVVDQTTYAEGVLVAVVLLAMAVGALMAHRLSLKVTTALVLLGAAQLLPVVSMGALNDAWTRHALSGSLLSLLCSEAVLVFAVVGLPCIAYGLLLPALCEHRACRAVGRIWSLHNVGCVLGGLAATFLLIPRFGVTATLAIATGCVALALLVQRAKAAAVLVAGLCIVAAVTGDATYRDRAAAGARLLYHHEDAAGVTEVVEDPADGSRLLLSSRRRQEGGSKPDQVVLERLQGELPLALHRTHERLLIIGLGTGITLGASVPATVREAVCVEISKGVIEASRFFSKENRRVLDDSRVTVLCEDGRNYVRLVRRRFGLIVQELFFPYRSGVGGLYTSEHYRRCRALLEPGGRVAQWIALAQITPDDLRCLVRTFADVFSETSLWLVGGYLMMLGGDQPLRPAAGPHLRHFVAAGEAVHAWARGTTRNTEDNMHIQASVPRAFKLLNSTDLTLANLRELVAIQQDADALAPGLPVAATRAALLLHRGILTRAERGDAASMSLYEQAYALDAGNPLVRRFLAEQRALAGEYEAAVRIDPTLLAARFNLGVRLYRSARYSDAVSHFRAVVAAESRAPDGLFNLANCLARLRHYREALVHYRSVLRLRPGYAQASDNMIEVERAMRRQRRRGRE